MLKSGVKLIPVATDNDKSVLKRSNYNDFDLLF